MLKYYIIILFFVASVIKAEPILLKNANELIGEHTESTNQRTLIGNVILQQKNVVVNSNSAIQYINYNRFLLTGNVIITQDSLILKSENVLYDGNTYIASSDKKVTITEGTEGTKKLIGNSGTYSTQTLIANFNDDVILEDDSLIVYADSIIYNRKTTESIAWGNVIVKAKKDNVFAIADTIFHTYNTNLTLAKSNAILLQIDTNQNLKLDTLTIKSDSILANRNENIYYFYHNVEIVRSNLKAISQQGIYYNDNEKIILFNPDKEMQTHSIVWLDSTQLHADSIQIKLNNNKLNIIHSYQNCIAITQNDSNNSSRIDQLAGNEIILYINNDTLNKIESMQNAKSLFFSNSNNEPDGLIESSAEKITIYIKNNKADEVIYEQSIPSKYHPEPYIYGKETNFYLDNFRKEDSKPTKPEIKIR
ncbi:MAG: LPS export ABC transporter periplasmic protein LptC [Bacteroidetes bacterium]|nr:LPS export ABC transporter periplasmic protein LptC [Bacteroidota bacterium]